MVFVFAVDHRVIMKAKRENAKKHSNKKIKMKLETFDGFPKPENKIKELEIRGKIETIKTKALLK